MVTTFADFTLNDDIEIKYLESNFAIYVTKHRAFKVEPKQGRSDYQMHFGGILKDHEKEYRVPVINEIECRTRRIYKGRDKPSTAGYSECFNMSIKSREIYEKQKVSIQNILQKSYDIAKNQWDKRLLIDPRKGTIKSALINIENDEAKTEEYAFKFLSEDYTYDVE